MANLQIIRELSEKKKISLREIARRIGITENGLQKIMERNSTGVEVLEKIAQVLDVPVGYFFDKNPTSISQTGRGNVIGDRNLVNISDCESKLESAEKEIAHLRELLQEKERTIQILFSTK